MSNMQKKTESSSTEGFLDHFKDISYSLFRLFKCFHQSKSTAIPDVWGLQILHGFFVHQSHLLWCVVVSDRFYIQWKVDGYGKKYTIGTTWVNWDPWIQQLEDAALLSRPGHGYIFPSKNLAWVTLGSDSASAASHLKWVIMRWDSLISGCKEKSGPDHQVQILWFWLQTLWSIPAPLVN